MTQWLYKHQYRFFMQSWAFVGAQWGPTMRRGWGYAEADSYL